VSDLIIVRFDSMEAAEEARRVLVDAQDDRVLKLHDAAIARQAPDGKVRIDQLKTAVGAGALGGAFWGLLVGLIFFMPVAGLAAGAVAGAIGGRFADLGIGDDFIRQATESIGPEDSALFLLVDEVDEQAFQDAVATLGGQIVRTSLTDEQEAELRAAWGSSATEA